MIKRIVYFFKHGIWQQTSEVGDGRKDPWYIRPFKVIIYTFKGFGEHQLVLRAAALTYYTLISIVPIAALLYAIIKGLGEEVSFINFLYEKFPEYESIITSVDSFAQRLLERTKGGVIASAGIAVLFWAVIRVFGNLETTMNQIWEIRKKRSFARKFSDYVAVVFIAPILWVISNGIVLYIRNTLYYISNLWLVDFLFALGSVVIIWVMFAFVYYVMPNTKVKLKSALLAGVVAGSVFQLFQLGYFWIQSMVSNYNAIYGSFAALPLFLVWLQVSWAILLFGAELSFAYQNLRSYEQERDSMHMSLDHKRKVLLATMVTIARQYVTQRPPMNSEQIADQLDLPVRIIREVLFSLETAGFVAPVQSEVSEKISVYVPARDVHEITVFDVIDKVESIGTHSVDLDESAEMEKVNYIIEAMKRRAHGSSVNVYITELT